MKADDFVNLLVQLGVMLGAAAGLGAIARRLRQPAIVGEMMAGILIGVTVLGAIAPRIYESIFAASADATMIRDAVVKVGMLLFLFVAGSEVDLRSAREIGRQGMVIGVIGTVLPILAGAALVYVTPVSLWGESIGVGRLPLALFIGINLANSANPVLARILIDLGLMKTQTASVMMTATVVDDLINWALYAVILGSAAVGGEAAGQPVAVNLVLVVMLVVVLVTVGRAVAPRLAAFGGQRMNGPAGYVTVATMAILVVSALTEFLGVHAFLGAFLTGVAFSAAHGDSSRAGHAAFEAITLGFFAPVFFASMALSTDFIQNFRPLLVVVVLIAALSSKLVSVVIGARMAGLPIDSRAWAIAWGLNARGATGIVLAGTGLAAGLISEPLFVALIVMCIVTSLLAGPMMLRLLPEKYLEGVEPG